MKKQTIRLLFLGASKRVSLFERFIDAAQKRSINLEIYSCEKEEDFYPVSIYARILKGPAFNKADFQTWLANTIDTYKIDLVIPTMDSATVALSQFKEAHCFSGAVVSAQSLCFACEDKLFTKEFFLNYELPAILDSVGIYPKMLKARHGFGAKGIYKVLSAIELEKYKKQLNMQEFVIEDFIEGNETTTDLYISASGEFLGAVCRDRLEVSDGEVMVCTTRLPENDENQLFQKIAQIPGWEGCITVQTIRDKKTNKLYILEINPRFGGGCTASMEAGLDMAGYILDNYLGNSLTPPKEIKKLKMTRARRDFFQYQG